MKKMMHILMLVVCAVSIICGSDAVANAKCVYSASAPNEAVASDNDDNGFTLIDCDALVGDNTSVLIVGESQPMRICDEQPPVRWVQSRGFWGRIPIYGKQNALYGRMQGVQIDAVACVGASVHFPLCLSANERIVALRHIIR